MSLILNLSWYFSKMREKNAKKLLSASKIIYTDILSITWRCDDVDFVKGMYLRRWKGLLSSLISFEGNVSRLSRNNRDSSTFKRFLRNVEKRKAKREKAWWGKGRKQMDSKMEKKSLCRVGVYLRLLITILDVVTSLPLWKRSRLVGVVSKDTLVRRNGEKLALPIANRSRRRRVEEPHGERVEQALKGEFASLARAKKWRDRLAPHLPLGPRRILTVCRRKVITNAVRSRSLSRRWVTKSRVLMQTRGGRGRNSLIIGRLWLIRGHFASVSARRTASERASIYQHPVDIRRGTRGQRIRALGPGAGKKN